MKKFQYKKKNLRPTSSKVIGAVFSILGHENLQGKNFLDLYAGTGALGLRALELGVSNCYFVDINNKFLQKIKNQVEKYDFEGEARMIKANCENQLGKISENNCIVKGKIFLATDDNIPTFNIPLVLPENPFNPSSASSTLAIICSALV